MVRQVPGAIPAAVGRGWSRGCGQGSWPASPRASVPPTAGGGPRVAGFAPLPSALCGRLAAGLTLLSPQDDHPPARGEAEDGAAEGEGLPHPVPRGVRLRSRARLPPPLTEPLPATCLRPARATVAFLPILPQEPPLCLDVGSTSLPADVNGDVPETLFFFLFFDATKVEGTWPACRGRCLDLLPPPLLLGLSG